VVTDSGTATVAGSGLNYLCGITGYRFEGSTNYVTLQPISDLRLKENIEPEILGLEFINALLPKSFNMIGQQRRLHGFIAQDVEPLIAHDDDALSIDNPNGYKGVDYMALVAPLVKAVQELSAEVATLKARFNGNI
jgi:hypothetical protein